MLAQHLSKLRSIENAHAELLRFLELGAWLRAREHVIRVFAHAVAGTWPPSDSIFRARFLARHRRQVTGEYKSAAACKRRVKSTVCVIPYEREIKACMTTNSRATDAIL